MRKMGNAHAPSEGKMEQQEALVKLIERCRSMVRDIAERLTTEEKLREFVRGTIRAIRSQPDGDELLVLLAETALMMDLTNVIHEHLGQSHKKGR
jgi:hypothetical protein